MLLFWCFGLFLIGYIIFIGLGEGFGLSPMLAGSAFDRTYSSILDIAGVLVTGAVVWAAVRRYIIKPKRLKVNLEASVVLILIFALMVLHFCVEGFGFAAYRISTSWPPIGAALANLLIRTDIAESTLTAVYQSVWWLHYAIILGFLVYIPRSKHLHILAAPLNVLFKAIPGKWTLKSVELEKVDTLGVSRIQEFTRKQLLDLYACTECGRCHDNCPAQLSSPLSPREVILNLKKHLVETGPKLLTVKGEADEAFVNPGKALAGGVVTADEIWACTACGACQEVCPVSIEHIDKIIDLRRHLVFEGKLDRGHEQALHRTLDEYNPWGLPWGSRDQWAAGLDVEEAQEGKHYDFLYWVGCAASFDDRAKQIARSLATILKQAGLKVATLGNEEMCCGEFARKIGDEGLFRKLALANIRAIDSVQASAVVTHCPHCFHTIKAEYPQLGGRFQIVHHTQVLKELLDQGKLTMRPGRNMRIVYHDPCNIGRYHRIFDEPRRLLKSIAGAELIEMKRAGRESFCCGAGGGCMWLETNSGEYIASERVQEAIQTGARTIVTACQFCLAMLEDTTQVRARDDVEVKDIVEMVDKATK